jgi:SpoVK/Ycf46/Vps4 family AAA+-type ATPase
VADELAEQISVTYDDIRLPADVIDSIKRLVSLTITHPEVSSYGTLQKGKIPGALLYGPPGTGKTLLAKAVARDSHALMLEVSSADILACRVGESEKIIKKLFALVIKLSPCVVFIDEADALLRGRGKGDIYWVRTQINQFLREWDGVTTQKKSAFIMVATNRPGDIDDAVLRRLPRRIEIPLPDVSARKEILDLYLQGETHEISTIRLARETDFYSGSDLRNLCTEAALTAAAELIEDGRTSWTQGEAPPRVLKAKHFEEAKRMIRPSVNHQILNEIEEFKARFGGGTKAKQNFAVDTYRHVSQWVRIRAKRR